MTTGVYIGLTILETRTHSSKNAGTWPNYRPIISTKIRGCAHMISKWAHKSMNLRNPSIFGKTPGTLNWQTCNAGLLLMLVILHDPGYLLTGNDGHTEVHLKTFLISTAMEFTQVGLRTQNLTLFWIGLNCAAVAHLATELCTGCRASTSNTHHAEYSQHFRD